jgi:hypothetical protein
MNYVNVIMFFAVASVGNFGLFLLWACVWIPIAASIKLEFEIANVGRYLTQGKVQEIQLEHGGSISVKNVDSGSSDLTVGMSMGES